MANFTHSSTKKEKFTGKKSRFHVHFWPNLRFHAWKPLISRITKNLLFTRSSFTAYSTIGFLLTFFVWPNTRIIPWDVKTRNESDARAIKNQKHYPGVYTTLLSATAASHPCDQGVDCISEVYMLYIVNETRGLATKVNMSYTFGHESDFSHDGRYWSN